MTMQVRGWRDEHTVWTTDTTGRKVPITRGLTLDGDGVLVAVIAVGVDGPSAVMPDELVDSLGETVQARDDARQADR
jgi:hypothetical protein